MRPYLVFALAGAAMALCACDQKPKTPAVPADANLVFKGSYAMSCKNVMAADGYLTADCLGGSGPPKPSKIHAALCKGDIGNNNGVLVCNGAVAESIAAPPAAALRPAP